MLNVPTQSFLDMLSLREQSNDGTVSQDNRDAVKQDFWGFVILLIFCFVCVYLCYIALPISVGTTAVGGWLITMGSVSWPAD